MKKRPKADNARIVWIAFIVLFLIIGGCSALIYLGTYNSFEKTFNGSVAIRPQDTLSASELGILSIGIKERLDSAGFNDSIVFVNKGSLTIRYRGYDKEQVKHAIQANKFEAKIGDNVFFASGKDITFVCTTADCSGMDPVNVCQLEESGYRCKFRFDIAISDEAANRSASITNRLEVISVDGEEYLSKNVTFYSNDVKFDELRIGSDMKGKPISYIKISGSGVGDSKDKAVADAMANMNRLQSSFIMAWVSPEMVI